MGNPFTDTAEPIRVNARIETDEPNRVKVRIDSADPSLVWLRNEREDPMCKISTIERLYTLPLPNKPSALHVLLNLAKERTLTELLT